MRVKYLVMVISVISTLPILAQSAELTASPSLYRGSINVVEGDTLWSLAAKHRPSTEVSVQQMMLAIHKLNPHAFGQHNVNGLKAGVELSIPSLEIINQWDKTQAKKTAIEHNSQWLTANSNYSELVLSVQSNPDNHIQEPSNNPMIDLPPAIDSSPAPMQVESPTQRPSDSLLPLETLQQDKSIVRSPENDNLDSNTPADDASTLQINGHARFEGRYFPQKAAYTGQLDKQWSGSLEFDFYLPWNDEYDGITFSPYVRKDLQDDERSLGDIRELKYFHVGDNWEIHVGIDQVFWGVAETVHLVDIINQTDAVAAPDGEDKLGQPMVHLSWVQDWGTLDFFVLPYFRERTFAGFDGRLRGPLPVNTDLPLYESSDEEKHVDFALRWNHSFDDWELALSSFSGTSREPLMVMQSSETTGPTLLPFYPLIKQFGIESIYLSGDWIWKLEGIHRSGNLIEDYQAADVGFEYTLYGIADSIIDMGLLLEFQYDSRGAQATSFGQNDIFFGTRIAFNDIDGSEILAGFAQDLDYSDSRSMLIEAKTRLSPHWTANLDLWLFSSKQSQDNSYMIRQDDHIQLSLEYFF
ncbi:FimV/HubP family polar landmark protein [Alteromonadaceae bacterium BrNp21-10]|nr:FimV/HubP family polar landmark protein [Alteromonadaceae bacterium BrNp21-10]